ncbi:ABC transporter substrate-binding protein [Novosphingobium bradum]|uniref:ABC transporter substrate-binding protein n=1 Tax=Novosphingobium bradum TaxID=1737444 RepID=A0ABV7IU87_9SPHN
MRTVDPVRVGILIDYVAETATPAALIQSVFAFVARELREQGVLERDVEFVTEAVKGLPEGSFRAVRDAYYRLVDAGCVAAFGPYISENGAPLREDVENLAEVPILTVAGTETMLGEWVFGLPAGSMEEEPIIMAQVAWYDGCRSAGLVYEDSLIGHEYLRSARAACAALGIRVTGEVAVMQVEQEKRAAMAQLAEHKPDAILHVGFGLGLLGINKALAELGWMPRRYTTTAFEMASGNAMWRNEIAGWIGLDQYDERNEVARDFFKRYNAATGSTEVYYLPALWYDVGRMLLTAVATARPLTGRGVKEALERIKMMPAATGAPGTRMRFGKFIRHGWVGSEFLVARRVLDDASAIVMHGTIEGLVPPAG